MLAEIFFLQLEAALFWKTDVLVRSNARFVPLVLGSVQR
jgi:hypothetical protein